VTPIRPATSAAIPTAGPSPAESARLAAQRAFFQVALGNAAPAAQTASPAKAATPASIPASAPARTPDLRATPPTEAPGKILRPGSLLDIRI
jgi:hypothetical protein